MKGAYFSDTEIQINGQMTGHHCDFSKMQYRKLKTLPHLSTETGFY